MCYNYAYNVDSVNAPYSNTHTHTHAYPFLGTNICTSFVRHPHKYYNVGCTVCLAGGQLRAIEKRLSNNSSLHNTMVYAMQAYAFSWHVRPMLSPGISTSSQLV